jgi:hypothetical protein
MMRTVNLFKNKTVLSHYSKPDNEIILLDRKHPPTSLKEGNRMALMEKKWDEFRSREGMFGWFASRRG